MCNSLPILRREGALNLGSQMRFMDKKHMMLPLEIQTKNKQDSWPGPCHTASV